jgi:hypothetical protein
MPEFPVNNTFSYSLLRGKNEIFQMCTSPVQNYRKSTDCANKDWRIPYRRPLSRQPMKIRARLPLYG